MLHWPSCFYYYFVIWFFKITTCSYFNIHKNITYYEFNINFHQFSLITQTWPAPSTNLDKQIEQIFISLGNFSLFLTTSELMIFVLGSSHWCLETILSGSFTYPTFASVQHKSINEYLFKIFNFQNECFDFYWCCCIALFSLLPSTCNRVV